MRISDLSKTHKNLPIEQVFMCLRQLVLSAGIEPASQASEARILSIELRERAAQFAQSSIFFKSYQHILLWKPERCDLLLIISRRLRDSILFCCM